MTGFNHMIRGLLPLAAGLLLFLGERVLAGSAARPYLSLLGVLALAAQVALVLLERRRTEPPGVRIWNWMLLPPLIFLCSAGFYGLSLLLGDSSSGALDWPSLAYWGWVLLALFGLALHLPLEMALAAQPVHPEHRRLRAAGSVGLRMGLALALAVTLNFVFERGDWQWDLAYFKTSEPSPASLEMARDLKEQVEAGLFFPQGNIPGELVEDYFKSLERQGAANLKFIRVDKDIRPDEAQYYKARTNGIVVLKRGEATKLITVGEDLDEARSNLAKFDRNFLARLRELTREKQVVYYTVGHGERLEISDGSRSKGEEFHQFKTLLRNLNLNPKPLGLKEGLGEAIPPDAALVIITAPRRPFLVSEINALRKYLDGGGNLLAFLEPRQGPPPETTLAGESLESFLAGFGVRFVPLVQANDRVFARRTYSRADHALLVTVGYANHPAVASMRGNSRQSPLIVMGSGALKLGTPPKGLEVKPVLEGMPGTWGDVNGNLIFDSALEKQEVPLLAVGVGRQEHAKKHGRSMIPDIKTKPEDKEPRPSILVFADADMASDLLLRNPANQQTLELSVGWVTDKQAPVSLPASEEDIRIQHAKDDDWLWFYLPVAGVPTLTLLVGFILGGRRRRQGGSK
ncbi:MAG: Gldg family protein [Deltaproteobacteria bacterium]|nr:Gldg family protein [Deltaproteobacteria bacterium]